ncbi:MAG: recombinase family protein [Planctomycetaceae bacterium]
MATKHSNGRARGPTSNRAAGYIRMSSAKQETSPAQQRNEIIGLAKRKGFEIVAWYIDEGISGDEIEKRPDFRRMLQDGQDGQFDVILCWDQDRFGRFDSLKAGYVIEPLRMRGVRLVTVTQGDIDWNDFAGRMIYAIQQEGKNQFLHSLSQNVLRGRIQQAKEGYGIHAAPYGYDRVFYDQAGNLVHRVPGGEKFCKPKNWKASIDIGERTEEVETVKYIFDRYANTDVGLREITAELNERGIRSRLGNEWNYCNVSVILKNPAYTGTLIYGQTPQGRFNHVGNGTIGGDGPIVVKNAFPAARRPEDVRQGAAEDRRAEMPASASPAERLHPFRDHDVRRNRGEDVGRRTSYGNRHCYYTIRRPNQNGGDTLDDCFQRSAGPHRGVRAGEDRRHPEPARTAGADSGGGDPEAQGEED